MRNFQRHLAALTAAMLLLAPLQLPVLAEEDDPVVTEPLVQTLQTEALTYEVTDGAVTITGLVSGFSGETLVIPAEIEGFPVTRIGASAFVYNETIREAVIPEGVTEIGDMAFLGCTALETVTVPDSVYQIGIKILDNTPWYDAQPNGVVYAGKVAIGYKGVVLPEELRFREGTVAIANAAFGGGMSDPLWLDGETPLRTIPVFIPKSMTRWDICYAYDLDYNSGMPIGNFYYEGTEAEWYENVELVDAYGLYSTTPEEASAYFMAHHAVYFESTEASHEPVYWFLPRQGDVNGDEVVDIMDVILLNKYLLGSAYSWELKLSNAEVTGDELVDSSDSLRILKSVVEIEPLPEPENPTVEAHNDFSEKGYTLTKSIYDLLDNAPLSDPVTEIPVYEGDKADDNVYQTISLSYYDIETLRRFLTEHCDGITSNAEKLYVTHQWIHYNNDYAYAGEKWDTIVGKSYTDAIFNYQMGQCIQYNGAMASMLGYLGYNVWMEGTPGVHWTTYIEIDGVRYHVEVGNFGKNGEWQTFFKAE